MGFLVPVVFILAVVLAVGAALGAIFAGHVFSAVIFFAMGVLVTWLWMTNRQARDYRRNRIG